MVRHTRILAAALCVLPGMAGGIEQESRLSREQGAGARQVERLKNADAFLLLLEYPSRERGVKSEAVARFETGQRMNFRLLIQNNFPEQVVIPRDDFRSEIRPALHTDGQLVPYRKEVEELVKKRDKEPSSFGSKLESLRPGRVTEERVDLADWYAPLEPGTYQLSVSRRFVLGGRWLESPSIAFEVYR